MVDNHDVPLYPTLPYNILHVLWLIQIQICIFQEAKHHILNILNSSEDLCYAFLTPEKAEKLTQALFILI